MATTRQEQKRNKIGAELDQTETRINQAFSALDGMYIRLNTIKTNMQNKPARFDADDIAEVDAMIASIAAKYTA